MGADGCECGWGYICIFVGGTRGVWVHVHVDLEDDLVSSGAIYHFLFLCLRPGVH